MHPFQCLLVCKLAVAGSPDVLLAASRSRLLVFSLSNGNLISTWQSSQKSPAASSNVEIVLPENDGSERPAKRLKKSSTNEGSDSSSAEIVTEDAQKLSVKSSKPQTGVSNIIMLTVSSDGQYIVAVTDEDKCVRVLHLDHSGCLQQLSERQDLSMPKRPCAIAFTPDQATIICGDKFGDVYALPLLCSDSRNAHLSHSKTLEVAQEGHATEDQFVPSATLRTVHTQRNQVALRHQQSQKNQKAAKSTIDFERELLFGHVSLLTDLLCLSIPRTTFADSRDRTYIISADRDEHIRVSRGMPQAHIIEGFCLGHTQFVSRLCVPRWNHHLLISGGGDDYLLVWDWLRSHILYKIDLRGTITDFMKQQCLTDGGQEREPGIAAAYVIWNGPIAVSEIFAFESKAIGGELQKHVAVVCEGVPGIIFFNSSEDERISYVGTIKTDATITALAFSPEHNRIVYATTGSHTSSSYSGFAEAKANPQGMSIGLLGYDVLKGTWDKQDSLMESTSSAINSTPTTMDPKMDGQGKPHSSESFLRSFETLRKRGQNEYDLI
ncbi:MAG: hypothetical protein Q9169_004044 [Polycauliona sp. 2 TL-2023]